MINVGPGFWDVCLCLPSLATHSLTFPASFWGERVECVEFLRCFWRSENAGMWRTRIIHGDPRVIYLEAFYSCLCTLCYHQYLYVQSSGSMVCVVFPRGAEVLSLLCLQLQGELRLSLPFWWYIGTVARMSKTWAIRRCFEKTNQMDSNGTNHDTHPSHE